MHSSISLSISLPSFSPLLNLSPHLFVTKQQRILRIFSFLHSIFIGIPLSLPSFQQANLITTSKYKQPHHTLQLQFHPSEIDRATHIQQLCKNVGIKSHLSSPAANQPLQPPQPKRAVIDLEKIPDTLEDIMMEEQKTPPQTQKNKKRPRSPSPSPSPSPTPAPALPPPSPSPPPSPKSYDLRSRKIIFQNFESQVSPIPPQKIPIPKNRPQKPQNMNSPNLKLLPPPPSSHCFGDPVYTYEYQLPNYPSHWRFRIFYNPRNKYYYYLSYGNVVDFDKFCKARRVV